MSGVEVYQASDREKEAFGVEFYLGSILRFLQKPLHEVCVLDCGGGTGNFTLELLAGGIGHVTMVDASPRMLDKARAKMVDFEAQGRAAFMQGLLPTLNFPQFSFDAVIFNMVLHHLPNDKGQFHHMGKAFVAAKRVLRPGGILFINTATPDQMKNAYWFHFLIPKASDILQARYPDVAIINHRLRESGFRLTSQNVPLEAVPQGKSYFDWTGPLQAKWRQGNSIWSFVSDEELERAVKTVNKLKADSKLEMAMYEHDRERRRIGQVTIFMARQTSDLQLLTQTSSLPNMHHAS